MKLLFFILVISSLSRCLAFANFSGITMTFADSPVPFIENIIYDVIQESKLDERMKIQYEDVTALKKALIKGALKDDEVLRNLVKIRDEVLPSTKNMPIDQQEREYEFCQIYLKKTAEEFGYRE
ncbi:MAG: hypothetical protein V4596_09000 [Bdellovibrionota bacterium]